MIVMNRFDHLRANARSSLLGWFRLAARSPFFAIRLLVLRAGFFATRRLLFVLRDPRGFRIDGRHPLISYWDFFVQGALQDEEWVSEFRRHPHPVAVDIGANAGMFSYLLTGLNPKAEIYAFEPLPLMAESLRRVQEVSGNTFHIFSAACGPARGEATLCADDPGDTDARLAVVGEGAKTQRIKVPVLPVDEMVQAREILLMKIDTQGYEIPVLQGARQTLNRTRYLILEIVDEDELGRMQSVLGPEWHARRITVCDFLFSRGGPTSYRGADGPGRADTLSK